MTVNDPLNCGLLWTRDSNEAHWMILDRRLILVELISRTAGEYLHFIPRCSGSVSFQSTSPISQPSQLWSEIEWFLRFVACAAVRASYLEFVLSWFWRVLPLPASLWLGLDVLYLSEASRVLGVATYLRIQYTLRLFNWGMFTSVLRSGIYSTF